MNEEYANKAADVASKGRYGDSMILHVNPLEVAAIDQMYPGMITRNPDTGQPEAFFFLLPLLGAIGTGLGAVGSGIAGATSALTGGLGSLFGKIGSLFGGGAGASGTASGAGGAAGLGSAQAAGVTTAGALPAGSGVLAPGATAGSGVLAPGATTASGLAPGGGVLAPAFGGGKTVAQVASQLNITPSQVVSNPQMAIDALSNPAIENKIAAKFAKLMERGTTSSRPTTGRFMSMQGGGIGSAKDIVANPDRYLASTDPTTFIQAAQPADKALLESFKQSGQMNIPAEMGTSAGASTASPSMAAGIQNTLSSSGGVLRDSVLNPIGEGIGSLATAAKNNPIPSLLVGYGAIDAIANAASGDGGKKVYNWDDYKYDGDWNYGPGRRAMSNINRPNAYSRVERVG